MAKNQYLSNNNLLKTIIVHRFTLRNYNLYYVYFCFCLGFNESAEPHLEK